MCDDDLALLPFAGKLAGHATFDPGTSENFLHSSVVLNVLKPLISSIAPILFQLFMKIGVGQNATVELCVPLPLVHVRTLYKSILYIQPTHIFTETHGQTSSTTQLTALVHFCHLSHRTKAGHLTLSHPPMKDLHTEFYLLICSRRHCRCFCWHANNADHLAVQNEEAQQMHMVKLPFFINGSMLFQFPPVKRLYRNNYWGK